MVELRLPNPRGVWYQKTTLVGPDGQFRFFACPPPQLPMEPDTQRKQQPIKWQVVCAGEVVQIDVEEAAIPVSELVRGACEILGLDPLYVANEGRFVAFVPTADVERALSAMRSVHVSSEAVVIGEVSDARAGRVTLRSQMGSQRILDRLSGEQLPRIC